VEEKRIKKNSGPGVKLGYATERVYTDGHELERV
jgi:hypothetical protein